MRIPQQFSIPSPNDTDAAVDQWLRKDVIPGHQEYLADPSKGVPADQLMVRLKARRQQEPGT